MGLWEIQEVEGALSFESALYIRVALILENFMILQIFANALINYTCYEEQGIICFIVLLTATKIY